MVFTQCSILNRNGPGADENRSTVDRKRTERIRLRLDREHPFKGFGSDLHYLDEELHQFDFLLTSFTV